MKDNHIDIRQLAIGDADNFIEAMKLSTEIHTNWVNPPLDIQSFTDYLEKFNNDSNYSFIIFNQTTPEIILGIVNITQIIRGVFQNGFLSYFATHHGHKTLAMYNGLQQVIKYAFDTLNLHRLEANIQPDNQRSINLIERLNFDYEGYSKEYLFINDKWRDHKRYALINNKHQFLS